MPSMYHWPLRTLSRRSYEHLVVGGGWAGGTGGWLDTTSCMPTTYHRRGGRQMCALYQCYVAYLCGMQAVVSSCNSGHCSSFRTPFPATWVPLPCPMQSHHHPRPSPTHHPCPACLLPPHPTCLQTGAGRHTTTCPHPAPSHHYLPCPPPPASLHTHPAATTFRPPYSAARYMHFIGSLPVRKLDVEQMNVG